MYVLLSINKLRKLFLLNSSTTFFLMEMLTKTPKFWKLEILYIKNVNCPQRSKQNLSDRLSLWMGERPKCLLNEPTWSLYLLVVKVESSTVRDPHYLGVGRGGAGVHRAAPGDDGPSRGWHTHTLSKFTDTHSASLLTHTHTHTQTLSKFTQWTHWAVPWGQHTYRVSRTVLHTRSLERVPP